MALQEGTRVTVKLDQTRFDDNLKFYSGTVVSQNEPLEKTGSYWGYQVRVATSIQAIFDECPYDGGYDLKINCTKQGKDLDEIDLSMNQDFKHALMFFQGLESLEGLLEEDEAAYVTAKDVHKFFDY